MPLACREYVTRKGCDEADEGLTVHRDAFDRLDDMYEEGRIMGFQVARFRAAAEIEEEDLDPEEILEASGGSLPVIWVNVTFDPTRFDPVDLAPVVAEYELVFLGEFERPQ